MPSSPSLPFSGGSKREQTNLLGPKNRCRRIRGGKRALAPESPSPHLTWPCLRLSNKPEGGERTKCEQSCSANAQGCLRTELCHLWWKHLPYSRQIRWLGRVARWLGALPDPNISICIQALSLDSGISGGERQWSKVRLHPAWFLWLYS